MAAFTKMQSLGNDFIMLDGIRQTLQLDPATVRRLADRHTGVGCDQLIVAELGDDSVDFHMRIFNADGGEVGQCGNGARCFARYLLETGLTTERRFRVGTRTTRLTVQADDDWQVSVEMGTPQFEPDDIPFRVPARAHEYQLLAGGENVRLSAVSIGNPHAVLRVDNVVDAPVSRLGPVIENHPDFTERTNVGFVEIADRGLLRLRVWERGVGETRACGSGACAATAVCREQGLVSDCVRVELSGGAVEVNWPGTGPLGMRGPAETVFRGEIELPLS
jgi:diaminopimelate epimerase